MREKRNSSEIIGRMMKEISPDRKRTADQRSRENGQDGCMMKDAGHPQGLSTGIRSFAVIKERGCAKASLFLVALRKTLYNLTLEVKHKTWC